MCNCIEEIEKMVAEKQLSENPGAELFDGKNRGTMLHTGFSFSANPGRRTYNEVEVAISIKKRNGQFSRFKKKRISVYASFCPFCGKKHNYEDKAKLVNI